MKYAIIGTGGIGGYYGGLLAKAGHDVHFLFHSDYEHAKAHGLQVDSCDGDYRIWPIRAYNSTQGIGEADVAIVALKTTAQAQLPALLRPVVGPHTIVLLIQNGIGVEADLQEALPQAQIAGGVAYICTLKTGPGHVTHLGKGELSVGSFSVKDKEKVARMVEEMRSSGIKAREEDYGTMRWKKAVWNMPFNGMTVAVGAKTSRSLAESPSISGLIHRLMLEVTGAARACGVDVADAYADQMMEMTRRMPEFASSMKFDYDHHRPLELHYLYERPIEEARRHGFAMPLMQMLADELAYMQEQNQ